MKLKSFCSLILYYLTLKFTSFSLIQTIYSQFDTTIKSNYLGNNNNENLLSTYSVQHPLLNVLCIITHLIIIIIL